MNICLPFKIFQANDFLIRTKFTKKLLQNHCITLEFTINNTKGSSLRVRLVGRFLKFGQEGQHLGDFFGDGRRSGQVVTDRAVASVIGGPGDGDLLALRSDPVGRSLVGVSCFVAGALLDVGFLASCSVGSSVTCISHLIRLFCFL